tara:strand:- start:393 stop:935 length:543 start_codon:yes stop_codon:yes gene_type:complete
MIVYRFKVTFEEVDDVERMIEVRANQTFRDLYHAIVESIKFDPKVTASFFMSGDNWRKGKEITNADVEGSLQMTDCKLNAFMNDPHQRMLLYTHDELEWSFRVQLFKIERANAAIIYPQVVKSIGEAPKQKKVHVIGNATNEFEELVDEIISEAEEPDVSDMGIDGDMDSSGSFSEPEEA